jgi:hypothetical protein
MKNSVLKQQVKTLKISLKIGRQEIAYLKKLISKKYDKLSLKDKKTRLANEAVLCYLINFWDQYEYLCRKLISDKDVRDVNFLVPHIRPLIELYAELLFFLSANEKNKVGIYVSYYLLMLSSRFNNMRPSPVIEQEYDRFLKKMEDVLLDLGIVFPKIKTYSMNTVSTLGFKFPAYPDIFSMKNSNFKSLSSETFAVSSVDTFDKFYDKYYRLHSSYTHRHFLNPVSSSTGNEIFWIIQFMYMMSMMTLELCNKKCFDNTYVAKYEDYKQNISINYAILLKVWPKV